MYEFEKAFDTFYEKQLLTAKGRRLERLRNIGYGEKILFRNVIWPVFQNFNDFAMEYEMKSMSGVGVFADAFYKPLNFVFECESFVPHAEKITRERFTFERARVRGITYHRYRYIPFSTDEIEKHPENCQRHVYELLGRYNGTNDIALRELTVYEREVIRYAIYINRSFQIEDVRYCLKLGDDTCRKILRGMRDKHLIQSAGKGSKQIRVYELTERALQYML